MKCPFCGHLGDKVVDSRESKEGEVIRRRRECLDCGRRFTSYERIDEIPYMVIKKDGTRERFERQKLVAGLLKACEKRPVSIAAIVTHAISYVPVVLTGIVFMAQDGLSVGRLQALAGTAREEELPDTNEVPVLRPSGR
jgi:transcriptional regulator NrdR